MSILKQLNSAKLLNIPAEAGVVNYEVRMGSIAYGASLDASDVDVNAISTPPLDIIYPNRTGYISGFGDAPPHFHNFQQHHIDFNGSQYDATVYGIVRTFQLASECNPNILDMLWVADDCVLYSDVVGDYIREHRKLFLHKGAFHRFRGYAHAQVKRLHTSTRTDLIEKFGYDTKSSYHILRLALQCKQILEEGDMDISRNGELLKAIRRGEWTLDELMEEFKNIEVELTELYASSSLQAYPNMKKLRDVLLDCIEMTHGTIDYAYRR